MIERQISKEEEERVKKEEVEEEKIKEWRKRNVREQGEDYCIYVGYLDHLIHFCVFFNIF